MAISLACIKPPHYWVLLYKVCKVRLYVWLYYFLLGWVVSDSCNPMDCSLPGYSPLSMGILWARILELVASSFSRGSSQPRNQAWVFCIAGRFFTNWATREALSLGSYLKRPWIFLSSQTEGIKYLEWPGYSWILGSLKSNVGCPYLSHMVGETDFRKYDEILFLSCRDGVETSGRRASCLWGVELVVERTGPGTARRLCREGTRRPGEYHRHHLRGHREAGPGDRWVEVSPATHSLCSLSDGHGRRWTVFYLYILLLWCNVCACFSFPFFSLLFPPVPILEVLSRLQGFRGFKKAAQIMHCLDLGVGFASSAQI